jgi:hypothetical protein
VGFSCLQNSWKLLNNCRKYNGITVFYWHHTYKLIECLAYPSWDSFTRSEVSPLLVIIGAHTLLISQKWSKFISNIVLLCALS